MQWLILRIATCAFSFPEREEHVSTVSTRPHILASWSTTVMQPLFDGSDDARFPHKD
jgi:hypothetical protein